MASTEIRRTTGSTPTNAEKFTVSLWFKLSQVGSSVGLFGWRENSNSGNNNLFIRINGSGNFQIYVTNNGGNHLTLLTNRLFRDCNSWYHAVISVDSSQSTSSDRAKLYINGIQETSFSSASYPASGTTFFSNDTQINFGKTRSTGDTDTYFSGIQSHIHFCDGYAYDASYFGSTDSTTEEWKINTSPSVSYGNNGFWWLKDSIATTDHSPNSNTWSSGGGTLTKTEDCPSNFFATLNPLATSSYTTLSKGNTKSYGDTSADNGNSFSTLAPNSGKYYVEAKIGAMTSNYPRVGIKQINTNTFGRLLNSTPGIAGYATAYEGSYQSDAIKYSDNSTVTWGSTYGAGDIISIALDCDNGACYMAKNGTWQESGNPTSGGSKTGAFLTWTPADVDGHAIAVADYNGSNCQFNFGNGYFDTTAVSSAGTNASGIGIFEYDVPTGYTALSTKGLNE